MKWGTLQPAEGTFAFAAADAQVAFAKAHGQAVRGHTLVWHQQNPAWLFMVNGAPMTPTPENTANATLDLSNNGPSGTARFNFNNPSTQVRFTSTDVITYDLTPAGAGSRVDFTVVGTSGDDEGVILTGYAIDGGPAGSGAALGVGYRADLDRDRPLHRNGDGFRGRRSDRALTGTAEWGSSPVDDRIGEHPATSREGDCPRGTVPPGKRDCPSPRKWGLSPSRVPEYWWPDSLHDSLAWPSS